MALQRCDTDHFAIQKSIGGNMDATFFVQTPTVKEIFLLFLPEKGTIPMPPELL